MGKGVTPQLVSAAPQFLQIVPMEHLSSGSDLAHQAKRGIIGSGKPLSLQDRPSGEKGRLWKVIEGKRYDRWAAVNNSHATRHPARRATPVTPNQPSPNGLGYRSDGICHLSVTAARLSRSFSVLSRAPVVLMRTSQVDPSPIQCTPCSSGPNPAQSSPHESLDALGAWSAPSLLASLPRSLPRALRPCDTLHSGSASQGPCLYRRKPCDSGRSLGRGELMTTNRVVSQIGLNRPNIDSERL